MMTDPIEGMTRLFAIIGDPISAVRSPQVFNVLFERHRVDAIFASTWFASSPAPTVRP